jgi:hypothetical protein
MTFDKSAFKTIEALKAAFGVSTNAEMVDKALGLARVMARHADDAHTALRPSKDGNLVKVHFAD